jgi:predicted PurR-regulated permease PerM
VYFVASLNRILGAYLRTQILMALLAGGLAAAGALIFGVPYAVVIFLTTFVLSLVPVIGPLLIPVPPILIAIVFTPLPGPVLYTIWILAAEQIITNIVGPRVQGHSVGIHPLEAMAAALVGFPVAGFFGAFFAVPAVAFLHVVIGSIAHARTEVRTAHVAAAATQTSASQTPLVGATTER